MLPITFNFQLLTFNSPFPAAIRQQATPKRQERRVLLPEKSVSTAAAHLHHHRCKKVVPSANSHARSSKQVLCAFALSLLLKVDR